MDTHRYKQTDRQSERQTDRDKGRPSLAISLQKPPPGPTAPHHPVEAKIPPSPASIPAPRSLMGVVDEAHLFMFDPNGDAASLPGRPRARPPQRARPRARPRRRPEHDLVGVRWQPPQRPGRGDESSDAAIHARGLAGARPQPGSAAPHISPPSARSLPLAPLRRVRGPRPCPLPARALPCLMHRGHMFLHCRGLGHAQAGPPGLALSNMRLHHRRGAPACRHAEAAGRGTAGAAPLSPGKEARTQSRRVLVRCKGLKARSQCGVAGSLRGNLWGGGADRHPDRPA